MKTEKRHNYEIYPRSEFGETRGAGMHSLTMPNDKARFAMALVERWGLVVGENDGEDSAGRAKLRSITPQELAQKACSATEELFAEFDRREWIIELPDIETLEDWRKTDKSN